jgi:hypothetical protein
MPARSPRHLILAACLLTACSDEPSSPGGVWPRGATITSLTVTSVAPSEVARDATIDIVGPVR